jgi:hypothetical protein
MNEIDGSFWAISLKARNVKRDFCANSKINEIKEPSGPRNTDRRETGQLLKRS